jgi:signal transduction histidine kinase
MIGTLNINTIDFSLANLLMVLFINAFGLLLVLTVITRNTFKDKITSVFAVMGLLMLIWIDFAYLARVVGAGNIEWAELFLRIAWVATPPFFAYVYLSTVNILRKEKQMRLLNKTLIAMALTLSFLTAFSDYIVAGVSFSGRDLDIIYGRGFYPFLGIISLFIAATIFPIATTRVEARRRNRVRIFLIGVAIFYVANLVFNISLPVFFDITRYYYLGDYSLVFIIGFTAYAILRYHFLDIKKAVFRGVGFALLTSLFFFFYGAAIYQIFQRLQGFDISTTQLTIIITLLIAFAIPLRHFFNHYLRIVTDKIFFQKKTDYRRALVEASKELSTTIKIDDVTKTILDIIGQTIRAKKTIIFLQDNKSHSLIPCANRGIKKFRVTIPKNHILVKYTKHKSGPLIKDELAQEREQEQNELRTNEIKAVEQAFDWLDAAVILPLYVNKQLTGLIALGDKKAGTPYLQDDLNFLATLAPQAATALQNAQLYQESLEFGAKLEIEVKRATRELAIANEQLRDLDKAKSEFLSIASHQLYTPLTAIRGYLSMLKEKDFGAVTKKQAPVIDILEKSSNRLINLIKNLLDISRIESGHLELRLESTDLAKIVDELIIDIMPNAIRKQLDLNFTKSKKSLPPVVVDCQRIRQVILNFIDNAIKYTDKGNVNITLTQEGTDLVLAVADTGKGLTKEDIAQLFNKFTRVGGDTRLRTEGTGLGLYVAKQIVKEHHGDIDVTSPGPGQGSTFSIRLPIEGSPHSLKVGDKATVNIKAGSLVPSK